MSRKTIVHVNMHVIRRNKKDGTNDPVLTVKLGNRNVYAHEVRIEGPSRVIYSPDKPLSCGAKVWIETFSNVVFDPEPDRCRHQFKRGRCSKCSKTVAETYADAEDSLCGKPQAV